MMLIVIILLEAAKEMFCFFFWLQDSSILVLSDACNAKLDCNVYNSTVHPLCQLRDMQHKTSLSLVNGWSYVYSLT